MPSAPAPISYRRRAGISAWNNADQSNGRTLTELSEQVGGFRAGLCGVVFDLDSQGLQELEILLADFEIRIAGQGSDHRGFVAGFFAGTADANCGFEHQENIVTAIFDPGDDVRNLFRISKRLVDGFAQFFHQVLQLLVHESPWSS